MTDPQNNVLYLIGPTGTGADKYEEYVYPDSNTGFVKIGDTSIDLSGYATSQEVSDALYQLAQSMQTSLDGKLPKSGGTLTGNLNLNIAGNSSNVLYASTNRELVRFGDNGIIIGNSHINLRLETDAAGKLTHKVGNNNYEILDTNNVKTINGASINGTGNLTLEDFSNKTNDIASNSSNTTKYPSCKGVVDYVADQTFVVTCGIDPSNIKHINKTLDDIWAAYSAGKKIRVLFSKASGVVFEEDATILIDGTRRCIVHTVVDGVHYIVTIYEENDTTKFSFETKEDNLFIAEYGVTTENDIYSAYDEGKIVIVVYNSIVYYLTNVSNGVTFSGVSNGSAINEITVSGSTWSLLTTSLEKTSDRISSITDDRRESKYPNERAVYDALFIKGVLAQTQTWSGDAVAGFTYVMSNIVRGDIAKTEIDKYTLLGATFNSTTGYFELNGITDISLEEIRIAYHVTYEYNGQWTNIDMDMKLRTTFPLVQGTVVNGGATGLKRGIVSHLYYFITKNTEVLAVASSNTRQIALSSSSNYMFYVQYSKLREVMGCICLNNVGNSVTTGMYFFRHCPMLETIRFVDLKSSWNAETLRRLSVASVAYAVEHAANGTTAITITLHADVYANCQADTTEYTYNSQTYTGIIALATAKNITIAQAS